MKMMVLGGFITVLGIATIAIAFAVLNTITMGAATATLVLGAAAMLAGVGLFGVHYHRYRKEKAIELPIAPEIP